MVLRGMVVVGMLSLGMGCAATAVSTTQDAAVRDVPAPDRSCTGQRGASTVEGVDPASGCPTLVRVAHSVPPNACERLEPRCTIEPACRFDVVLEVRGVSGCPMVIQPRFGACRCEFGVVECPGQNEAFGPWPGCVGNNYVCDPCR